MSEDTHALPLPSERSFGTVFILFFALLAGLAAWRASSWALVFATLSALTLIVTLARPIWLRPLNRQWMRLAALLNAIVSPIVLGLMFFALFAPIGLAMRAFGRDALRRRFEAGRASYWIDRDPPGPDPKSFPQQF